MTNYSNQDKKVILAATYADAEEYARRKGWSRDEWICINSHKKVYDSNKRIFSVDTNNTEEPMIKKMASEIIVDFQKASL